MPLAAGTRLGPYEVIAPVGLESEQRYKATDTRTNRIVVLRVLPNAALTPADRERFARDTTVISSLRHPNISAPVEVGHEEPATDFVVTEYVEGETLAARLARGPMELSEALRLAVAVADSLDKAHRGGVVHGGLTPSAVMLTTEGPKLLDFGLARLGSPFAAGAASSSASMASTRTSVASLSAVPEAAAGYMAPERFAGTPADARSDIFAAGAMLYEMVTGRPAFHEKTYVLLLAAIQTVDPEPASSLQPMAPAALDHVIARCLAKDPAQRLQTAWDLVTQLRWIADGGSQVGVPAPVAARRASQDRLVWTALGLTAVVAALLVSPALSFFRDVPARGAVRFTAAGLPTNAGIPIYVSPDGRWIAGAPGQIGFVGVSLGSVTPQTLLDQYTVAGAFWSRDSRSVAFFENGLLKRAEIAGGPAQTVTEAPGPIASGSWSGNEMLFSSQGVIYRVSAQGGESVPVTSVDESGEAIAGEEHLGPSFLPDGRHFVYLALGSEGGAVYVGSIDSVVRIRLFEAESFPVYAEPGYILFNRANTLFAQPFDAGALALSGEPIRLLDGVAMRGAGINFSQAITRTANYSVSQTGVLAFKEVEGGGGAAATAAGTPGDRSLVWLDRQGRETAQVGTGAIAGIAVAPDGERFAVHVHEGDGGDIWTYDPDRRRMGRFTFAADQENSSPIWSPDGSRIAFASMRDGQWGLYLRPADGSGQEELIVETGGRPAPWSWSPDGALLVYSLVGRGADLWAVPVEGDPQPVAMLDSDAAETSGRVSPDGRWIAYQSSETGTAEIYVRQFPEGPAKAQVSDGGGQLVFWRDDGRELFYLAQTNMMAVDIDATGAVPRPGVPRSLFTLPGNPNLPGHFAGYDRYAVSPDGQRFLTSRPGAGAQGGGGRLDSVILQQIEQGTAGTDANTHVILDWPQMLEER